MVSVKCVFSLDQFRKFYEMIQYFLTNLENTAFEQVISEIFKFVFVQAICSRSSNDTSEDFIEGLRHFDKVSKQISNLLFI